MADFFRLKSFYGQYSTPIELESEANIITCPLCGAIHVERLSALTVYFKGKKQADYYSVPQSHMVDKRLREALIQHNVSGCNFQDILITGWFDKSGNALAYDPSDLQELVVTGRGGKLHHKNGSLIECCRNCGTVPMHVEKSVNGLSVNQDAWDHTEMFYFDNWQGVLIVTERVKHIVENGGFTNIEFQNISEFVFS